ncbi:MAG: hypothetical protein GXY41_11405 [Phycisphaerae bacterium]|nr:hypothetical protein [Phycisphaerae bacterium]
MKNESSEQELKQLFEEGKISEDEYRQLREALHQKDTPRPPIVKPPAQAKPRTGFGKAALILMIVGILLPPAPLVLNIILAISNVPMPHIARMLSLPFLLLSLLCLLLAFIFGILGWKTTSGKIAAIGTPCIGLLLLPGLLILSLFANISREIRTAEYSPGYHKAFPLDSMEGILTRDGVAFDDRISFDGKGSLRIRSDASEETVFRLLNTGPLNLDHIILIYSAKLRTEQLEGRAYLEMWCEFPGKGEFFSRGIEQPVTGTTEWTAVQTPFRLEAGQRPANVKLNLVIEGAGTVWIDDIQLLLSDTSLSNT